MVHSARMQHAGDLADLDWDLGRLPLNTYSMLATCLEEDLVDAQCLQHSHEEVTEPSDGAPEGCTEEKEAVDEKPEITEEPTTISICLPLKRKLGNVDFRVPDRGEEEEVVNSGPPQPGSAPLSGSSLGHAQIEKREQASNGFLDTAHTLDEFYSPIRTALSKLRDVLSGGPPVAMGDVTILRCTVVDVCDQLRRLICVRPRVGLCRASHVVELIQSQITERDDPGMSILAASSGICIWCDDVDIYRKEANNFEKEEREFALADIYG